MKVHVIGGFLGAGKTTAMRAMARVLRDRGERVAIITNDQGHALVDTALCEADGARVREIGGGCFCCRYPELEDALFAAAKEGATVAIAEAVGSCTDLVATVMAPLADRHPSAFRLAPFTVVVDPFRVAQIADPGFGDDVRYLFHKQIEEADVVVLSRADLDPPDVTPMLRELAPHAAVVKLSGRTGEGVGAWLAAEPRKPAEPLDIDYDRYAAAEAALGWSNGRVRIVSRSPFSPAAVLARFFDELARAPVAHLKVSQPDGASGSAALTSRGGPPALDVAAMPAEVTEIAWLVNARVALAPPELASLLRGAMARAASPAEIVWDELACFQPGRPTPVHRYTARCCEDGACEPAPGLDEEASCCAAFYSRRDVTYLLGDSFHPGGPGLTRELASHLALGEDRRVLDVACGKGTSLRVILQDFRVRAAGIDASTREVDEDRLVLRRGDAHAIPFDAASFDAVLCECALSTFVDQGEALREIRRVLAPGGRLAVSDMVVEGAIPEALAEWVHSGTCLARARDLSGYERLLTGAGLRVIETWDATPALRELLGRVKRNLVGAALAKASGVLPADVAIDMKKGRDAIRLAEAAVEAGAIRYGVLIAERPALG